MLLEEQGDRRDVHYTDLYPSFDRERHDTITVKMDTSITKVRWKVVGLTVVDMRLGGQLTMKASMVL